MNIYQVYTGTQLSIHSFLRAFIIKFTLSYNTNSFTIEIPLCTQNAQHRLYTVYYSAS